ncbi:MAG TPA: geranylgeranyl reductase family protein [Streptosporangiaceae bacterium]|jgi:geranylgeranyl reductase family protein|nr:geranylgeranyl reductase family protein [Streptosporangiaceae bacterium]
MAEQSFDVVVVGAGPAGSIAALVLARAGASVGLVDKAAFPRDKACGDLVGPRGVQVLADLGITVPDAGHGSDLLAVGPSGRVSRLPAFPGRSYPGHGVVAPRIGFDHALREAAIAAGASPVRARITGVEADPAGSLRAVIASDGRRLAAGAVIGADGALSPVAKLTGMLQPETALWGFAIRAYLPAEVPLPLLVLLDAAPWRIYPGYGWLFPGADGQANVGIGVGLGSVRRSAPLRDDLARFCAMLARRGDLGPGVQPGPVMGGWLRMGGTGTPPAAGNVLLIGDAAGLINPLQGEGIGPGMVSARLAAQAVLDRPADPGPGYTEAVAAAFGGYLPGASALQSMLLRRPRLASAGVRLLTVPGVRQLVAGTWSLYWNGLVDGARPRPSAWTASLVQRTAGRLAGAPGPPAGETPAEPAGHLSRIG